MRTRLLTVGIALGFATLVRADFTPIPLNPSSFNHDVVVEATSPAPLNAVVNATMDGGTNMTGNTWYERGFNTAAPTTGLPTAGSTLVNGAYTYQMPADYHVNNAIIVGHHNGGRFPIFPTGTLTLTTPAAFNNLSFLTASGNGPVLVGYILHYADSTTESNVFSSLDWFNNNSVITNCAGRVSLDGGVQNVGGSPAGTLHNADVAVGNPGVNITSIDFVYAGSGGNNNTNNNGRAVIFAVSGSTDGINYTTPLAVTGFNYDPVVEADAPQTTGTGQASASILTNHVTATMDGGIWLSGNCWYEKGYYTNFPNTGIPAAGSTFHSAWLQATYTMPASYAGNCAAFVSSNVLSANIVFAAPTSAGALSFLGGCANGDTFVPCVIGFQDGTTETNTIFVPDWFNRVLPFSYLSFGRVNPGNRTINQGPERFANPFVNPIPGPFSFDFRGLGLPAPMLFDAVINVTNATGLITNISLAFTNGSSTRAVSIFAVSGAPAASVPPIFGYRGTPTPGQPANAARNAVNLVKAYEGTNNIVLAVTNIAGTGPITYQWMKAPRGGGLHDIMYTIDYSTFANLVDGGRISGANSSVLVISNALSADSADYLAVASNASGSCTSFVATVMILTTNQSLLVGAPLGDVIASYTSDTSPAAESVDHAIDQLQQKWLSFSLNNNTLPWVGPVGYVVTPVSGSSIPTAIRFFTANDTTGRDPYDYTLEGSNDGTTWTRITGGVLKGTLSLPTARDAGGAAALDPLNQPLTEVNFPNATGYKSFRVTITNNFNCYGDALMQIGEIQLLGTLVPNPPVWVHQPDPAVIVFAGGSPTFTVEASGYPHPRYQWYKNGTTLIPDATNASYTLPNAQAGDSGTTFTCTAINTFGTITSSAGTLSVITDPTQAYPTNVIADQALGYWRLNETPDDGNGNNGKVAHDYMGGHNGYYSNAVIAVQGYNPTADPDLAASFGTFAGGPIYSNNLVANIQGVDFARATNANAAFSVEAWVFGGPQTVDAGIVSKGYNGALNVGTGTGTEQFVLDVTGGTPRKFRFLVRDAAGNGHFAQSAAIPFNLVDNSPVWHHVVGVCDQPNGNVYIYVDGLLAGTGAIGTNVGILTQPLPMTIGARQSGGSTGYDNQWNGTIDDVAVYATALTPSQVLNHYYAAQLPPIISSVSPTNSMVAGNSPVTISASAYGSGTLHYQWWNSDGINPTTPFAGQTTSNLTFTTASASSINYYELIVTNNYGSATSVVATLTVQAGAPTFITDLPATSLFNVGHIITLHVVPGGTAPFTYVWTKNGNPIVNDYRTSGQGTDTLTIGYAATTDSGTYQVTVSNGSGSAPSTADTVSVVPGTANFFSTTAGDWSLQGTTPPVFSNGSIQLTAGLGSTARSAFMTAKKDITAFNASFVYQCTSGAGGADGVSFCVQNVAVNAVGGAGGAIGYGGIGSAAVGLEMNIYAPNTRGIQLVLSGAGAVPPFTPILPVDLGNNTDQIRVDLAYASGTLGATFTDLNANTTFSTSFSVNIPTVVGGNTAWVGFTGADGGVSSTQLVFVNVGGVLKQVPLNTQVVGNSLIFSWPANIGAILETSPSLSNPTWVQATDQFSVVGSNAQVTAPISKTTAGKFYRLHLYY